jgi:hypothetical protein
LKETLTGFRVVVQSTLNSNNPLNDGAWATVPAVLVRLQKKAIIAERFGSAFCFIEDAAIGIQKTIL